MKLNSPSCRMICLLFVALLTLQGQVCCQDSSDPEFTDEVQLILPDVIYAVPGIETNIYFENVTQVINPANYVFDVFCDVGKTQQERWTITPTDEEVGEHELELLVINQKNQVIDWQKSKLIITPKETGNGLQTSLLMIGDSLTQASIYPKQVFDLCGASGLDLNLVGSFDPGNNGIRHEGYGGWTAVRFATHYTGVAREGDRKKRGSPFLFMDQSEKKPKLDFKKYCEEVNGSKYPEFVTIFLGPNDVYSCNMENLEPFVERMIQHLDLIVEMIRKDSPSTQIGLMLPVPSSASQDSFAKKSGRLQSRWQYKINQHYLVRTMFSHYKDSEVVSLIPTYTNIDTVHNYPTEEVPVNGRSEEKIVRQNNAVHPARSGYLQIGDTVYCWLKAQVAQKQKQGN